MKKLLLLLSLFSLTACHEPFNEQHATYLENNSWHIHEEENNETILMDWPEEILANYEASGVSFLRDYVGQNLSETVYELKEKDAEGNGIKAIIYESNGEIIGGYGVLPSWTPGVFSLVDKERLISEGIIGKEN